MAGQRIDDVEIAHRLGGAGMRPERFDVDAWDRLRRGDQGVREPAIGQADDEVVDRAVRAALDYVKGFDVDAGGTESGRDGTQRTRTVRQDQSQEVRHATHTTQAA